MKKNYQNPIMYVIEISALIDTIETSDRFPVVTDDSNFGKFHPLG